MTLLQQRPRWSGRALLVVVFAVLLIAPDRNRLHAQGSAVVMRVQPASHSVAVDQTFTVQLVADLGSETDPDGLAGYEFGLTFDDAYLQLVTITDAGQLSGPNNRTVGTLGPNVDGGAGQALFGAYSYSQTAPLSAGPTGTVVLADVTLRAKQPGETTVGLENALLTDVQARMWPDSGAGRQVTTQSGTISISQEPAQPTATSTVTLAPTATGTATITLTPTSTSPSPTSTRTTPTASPTSTLPSPTSTPTSTASPTPTATQTVTPAPTESATPSPTSTSSLATPSTPTSTPSATATRTVTSTSTSSPTSTSTVKPTAMQIATVTPTSTATTTPTGTPQIESNLIYLPLIAHNSQSTTLALPTATPAGSSGSPIFTCGDWCQLGNGAGMRRQTITSDRPLDNWQAYLNELGPTGALFVEKSSTRIVLEAPAGFRVRVEGLFRGEWLLACESQVECLTP